MRRHSCNNYKGKGLGMARRRRRELIPIPLESKSPVGSTSGGQGRSLSTPVLQSKPALTRTPTNPNTTTTVPHNQPAGAHLKYQLFLDQCDTLIRKWNKYYLEQITLPDADIELANYVNNVINCGLFNNEDMLLAFIRTAVYRCLEGNLKVVEEGGTAMRRTVYESTDAVSKLVTVIIRRFNKSSNTDDGVWIKKFFAIMSDIVSRDHNEKGTAFRALPYHRFIIMFFMDMCEPNPCLVEMTSPVITLLCVTLHHLRPSKLPGFAYAWIEIVGHRLFLQKLLFDSRDRWNMYCQLLIDMIEFLEPFLGTPHPRPCVMTLYTGLLRIFIVILHDAPDFLSDYSYQLVAALPPNLRQLRNLILSAFPATMHVPRPFQPDLGIEFLPDSSRPPRIWYNVGHYIPAGLKSILDAYLKHRGPVTLLEHLLISLLDSTKEAGVGCNVPVLNAVVLYCGSKHVAFLQAIDLGVRMSNITQSPYLDVFEYLATGLDNEGKYWLFSGMADQLRYPSSHTAYFKLVMTHLYAASNDLIIKAQIVRVLFERLFVSLPHPWGLLVTTFELFKNPVYNFWDCPFLHANPVQKKLLQQVYCKMKRDEEMLAWARRSSMATSTDHGESGFQDFLYDHSMEDLAGLEYDD